MLYGVLCVKLHLAPCMLRPSQETEIQWILCLPEKFSLVKKHFMKYQVGYLVASKKFDLEDFTHGYFSASVFLSVHKQVTKPQKARKFQISLRFVRFLWAEHSLHVGNSRACYHILDFLLYCFQEFTSSARAEPPVLHRGLFQASSGGILLAAVSLGLLQ